MAITRLKRKGKRNKAVASQRISAIKLLTATPVIKNVDIEELKAGFSAKGGSKAASKTKKEESAETVAEKQEEPSKNHPADKE